MRLQLYLNVPAMGKLNFVFYGQLHLQVFLEGFQKEDTPLLVLTDSSNGHEHFQYCPSVARGSTEKKKFPHSPQLSSYKPSHREARYCSAVTVPAAGILVQCGFRFPALSVLAAAV